MVAVEFRGVSKRFAGGVVAVADLTLRIEPGECLVVLGLSGSGKTTALRLLAGLETPTAGTIAFDGQIVTGVPPHRRRVGFVPQRPVLYPHLSVRDNLRFGADRLRRRADLFGQVTTCLHLDSLLDRWPTELSGGQQQRVALGRAILREPALLLLDEPLASLDRPHRWELCEELHLLRRHLGATMVVVTHEQDDALALADRIAVFQAGQLVQVGRPGELLARPLSSSVARLLGWPPINLLAGHLARPESDLGLLGDRGFLPIRPEWADQIGRPVLLGIRPQAIRMPATGTPGSDEEVVSVTPSSVQPAAATGFATALLGGWSITGRRMASLDGGQATAAIDRTGLLLFDAGTGKRLRP